MLTFEEFFVDEVAAQGSSVRVHLGQHGVDRALRVPMAGLESLQRDLEAAVTAQDFELAAELRDRERKLRDRIDAQQQEIKDQRAEDEVYVTEEDIAKVVAKRSN